MYVVYNSYVVIFLATFTSAMRDCKKLDKSDMNFLSGVTGCCLLHPNSILENKLVIMNTHL